MDSCPKCSKEVPAGSYECPFCGIIFSKYKAADTGLPAGVGLEEQKTSPPASARPPAPRTRPQAKPQAKTNPLRGITIGLLLGLIGLAAYVWFVWLPDYNRGKQGGYRPPENAGTVKLKKHEVFGFDFYGQLPSGPTGMTWTGEYFLMANRADPWGFFRMTPKSETKFKLEVVPVTEPGYWQTVSFDAVTWNGEKVVALAGKGWFTHDGDEGTVFTIHEPEKLTIERWVDAPNHLGALVWDGQYYWAGGRKNTRDADEPEGLYQFDGEFTLLNTWPAPGSGCQALIHQGNSLLWLDVFDDAAYLIDISGAEPELVQESRIPFNYPSGGCFDGEKVWIAEYGDNRVHQVNDEALRQWLAGELPMVTKGQPAPPAAAGSASDEEIAEAYRNLKSDDQWVRMEAEQNLKEWGQPVTFARSTGSAGNLGPEEQEVVAWSLEVRDGNLFANWDIFFGEALFNHSGGGGGVVSMPHFTRYTITVEGPGFSGEKEFEFDAVPGHNIQQNYMLGGGLKSGEYNAGIFLHTQYVKPDGGDMILNESSSGLRVDVP